MNIQDLQEKLRAARTTIKNRVSPAVGRKLMIVAGGVTLLAGGAGTAMAMQSHAQSRAPIAQVQTANATNQSIGAHTGGDMHGEKPAAVGTVTAVSGSTLTVSDTQSKTTYTVDASAATITKVSVPATATSTATQPAKPTETTISVSDIAVGDTVMVQGTISGTSIAATAIHDGQMPMHGGFSGRPHDAAHGTVAAVSGDTLTVIDKQSNTTYTVDASTASVKKITFDTGSGTTANTNGAQRVKPTETTITASDIAVGDTVMVQGTVSGTTVTATSITDGNFPIPPTGGMFGHKKSASSATTKTN